jgi:hypothetical protein
MPFYQLHLNDEKASTSFHADDLGEARCQATKMAGQIICDDARTFWDKAEWLLTVSDAGGLSLFQLQLIGTDAPVISRPAVAVAL